MNFKGNIKKKIINIREKINKIKTKYNVKKSVKFGEDAEKLTHAPGKSRCSSVVDVRCLLLSTKMLTF